MPDITYHYRVVAVNAAGTSYGNDMSFRTPAGTLGWYDITWQHRQEVTIDSAMADADLENFPLLIKITDPLNKVFRKALVNGDDILFTLSRGINCLGEDTRFVIIDRYNDLHVLRQCNCCESGEY